jgi:transcription-repair coupling factor (superfamily II helicase)
MSNSTDSSNVTKPTLQLKSPVSVFPEHAEKACYWGRLYGNSDALFLSQTAQDLASNSAESSDSPLFVVCQNTHEAIRLEEAVRFFLNQRASREDNRNTGLANDLIIRFPDLETLPYDRFSPHPNILSQRLKTLYQITQLNHHSKTANASHVPIVICSLNSVLLRLPPRSYVEANSLLLKPGNEFDLEGFRQQLERAGYYAVSEVRGPGEFAVRGSLLDLFPSGSQLPFRIDLFDREIESIRSFDVDTQRTIAKLPNLRLLPAREFPLHDEARRLFRQNYRERFEGDPTTSVIYRDISEGNTPPGIEYYLPLFFEYSDTLFDYLPNDSSLVFHHLNPEKLEQNLQATWQEIEERYDQRAHDIEYPILKPGEIFIDPDEFRSACNDIPSLYVSAEELDPLSLQLQKIQNTQWQNFATRALPSLRIDTRHERPLHALEAFLIEEKNPCLIIANSAGRREIIAEYLREHQLNYLECHSWDEFKNKQPALGLTVCELDAGLLTDEFTLISEAQLFGEKVKQSRRQRQQSDPATIIRDLTDLSPGSPVVHEQHGIGRYMGLETLDVGGLKSEFLLLHYAGNDKLYVPVHALHLITRYTGSAPEKAPLHRLGSDQWQRAKKRAATKVHDMAAELLDIYSRRAARQGHAFPIDEHEYRLFAEAFQYEETPDQAAAIDDVLDDMRSAQPMDRVVCGDVGFGKTEVALRAAFVCINAGRQAAILVPTTLLAQQHYQSFRDRFADWPFKVEVLSRFRSAKETTEVLKQLAAGKVDVVIGTHKLLSKDIKFKDLGLIVIDEEHRFGVKHKEQLKNLRAEVDVLTLTATPIPRTLNMALGGIRELSLITTAPVDRLAVKTFISSWDASLIREACLREIRRGGQVYFVHNEVKTLNNIADELQQLLPEVEIRLAHGQMTEGKLEQVMLDFYHRRFQVLLCTTIIESGIDNPIANTIIINRADKFGLSQLHQLRGRVGRSSHRAYAYMMIPNRSSLTDDAEKRIAAIESMDELGTGFMLATHDLEIRGAGELLGKGQSGQIQEIGFTLFMEMLERAVAALRSGEVADLDKPMHTGPEINLHIPALIPDDFMPDVHLRLILYKRMSSVNDQQELQELHSELIDRFGPLPDPVKNLLQISKLKIHAEKIGIKKIDAGDSAGTIFFASDTTVEPMQLIRIIRSEPHAYKLLGADRIRFYAEFENNQERFDYLHTLMTELAKPFT